MDASHIKATFEGRRNAVEELRALYDANPDGLDAEGVAKEARLNEAINEADERIRGGLDALEAEKRAQADAERFEKLTAESRKAGDDEQEPSLLDRFVSGEVRSIELGPEQRDLLAGTATDGQELVPETLYGRIIEHMVEASPIMRSGVTTVRTAGGEDLVVPRTTSYSSASLVAEAGSIGESDPQFATVTLGAYKYAFLTQVSTELLQDSAFDVPSFLARQGGAALGRGVDAAFVSGSGSGQPNGIDNVTLGDTLASASAVTPEELIDAVHTIIPEYRPGSVWYMSDATAALIRKLRYGGSTTGDGAFIWQPGLQAGQADTLLGYPVFIEPNLADLDGTNDAVVMVFGNPEGFMVRQVASVRVESSTDFAFANDLTTWRFITRVDSDIVDTNALRRIQAAAA